MRKLIIVANQAKQIQYDPEAEYIGVDRGAWFLYKQAIPMICAIGDFDSIDASQLSHLQAKCQCIILNVKKNETDTEYAIMYAQKLNYDQIVLYGGLGGRVDHELANVFLMLHRYQNLILADEHQVMQVLSKGEYVIKKQFHYLSFLALQESVISEKGVAYPLTQARIHPYDIFTISNEIVKEKAEITIHEGSVLMIQSEDIKNLS